MEVGDQVSVQPLALKLVNQAIAVVMGPGEVVGWSTLLLAWSSPSTLSSLRTWMLADHEHQPGWKVMRDALRVASPSYGGTREVLKLLHLELANSRKLQ